MPAMNKLWLLAALGACAAKDPSTPLADLDSKFGAPSIELVAQAGQVNIELHVAESTGCPQLRSDIVATFDGQPMRVSAGGYDTDHSGCYPIAFWFDSVPTDAIVGFESQIRSSQLQVVDPSATWNIATVRLLSNDFEVDAANSRIVWEDVTAITSAEVFPGARTTIVGNEIDYPAGTQIQGVSAYAYPSATVCTGPTLCTVSLQGSRSWNGTPP
jgi:hypothetical protein